MHYDCDHEGIGRHRPPNGPTTFLLRDPVGILCVLLWPKHGKHTPTVQSTRTVSKQVTAIMFLGQMTHKNGPFWATGLGSAKKSPFGGYKKGLLGNRIAAEGLAKKSLSEGGPAEDDLAEEGLAGEGLAAASLAEEGIAEESLTEECIAEEGLAEESPAKMFRPGLYHTLVDCDRSRLDWTRQD